MTDKKPVIAITALFALNGAALGMWASRIPAIARFHDLSKQELGLVLLVLGFGALISFTFAGLASDKFGARRVCQVATLIYVIALILVGASSNIVLLCFALLIFGAGLGACDIAMNVWAVDWDQQAKTTLMPYYHAMWSVGGGLGAAAGASAAYLGIGYGIQFSTISILFGLITLFLTKDVWHAAPVPKSAKTPAFQFPKGNLVWAGLIALCTAIGEGAMTDWSALLMLELTSATEAQAALGFAVYSAFMVITRLSGHILMRHFSIPSLTRMSGAMSAIGLLMMVSGGGFTIAMIGCAMAGVGLALIFPFVFQAAGNNPNMPKGAAIASVASLAYGGILFGPPIIGFIAEATSLRISFALVALLSIFVIAKASALVEADATE